MERRRRIALYGGTFDPVHRGHIEIARKVTQLFEIDELFFVPAQVAPHKINRDVTGALHRYAMLALATGEEPRFKISTFELEARGHGYTVDTLSHFKSRFSDSADLFFIMGADSWAEITTWRAWERVLALANHIVVTRPGCEVGDEHTPSLAARIVDLRGANSAEIARSIRAEEERIFITDAVMVDVSATAVRHAVRENPHALKRLVPSSVADYISKYGLYTDSNET